MLRLEARFAAGRARLELFEDDGNLLADWPQAEGDSHLELRRSLDGHLATVERRRRLVHDGTEEVVGHEAAAAAVVGGEVLLWPPVDGARAVCCVMRSRSATGPVPTPPRNDHGWSALTARWCSYRSSRAAHKPADSNDDVPQNTVGARLDFAGNERLLCDRHRLPG
jgi:hypothetical protein